MAKHADTTTPAPVARRRAACLAGDDDLGGFCPSRAAGMAGDSQAFDFRALERAAIRSMGFDPDAVRRTFG